MIVSHALRSVRTLCDQVALARARRAARPRPRRAGDRRLPRRRFSRPRRRRRPRRAVGLGRGPHRRVELLDAAGGSTTARAHRRRGHAPPPLRASRAGRAPGVRHRRSPSRRVSTSPGRTRGRRARARVDRRHGPRRLRIDRLLLLPGTYDLTVAFSTYAALHPFDHPARRCASTSRPATRTRGRRGRALGGTWDGDALRQLDCRERAAERRHRQPTA